MPGDDSLASDIHQRAQRLLLSLQQHASQLREYNAQGRQLAQGAADGVEQLLQHKVESDSK